MDSQFDRERGVTPARAHAELPLPATPLPRPNTSPRPFDIDVEVRQFVQSSAPVKRLVLTNGTEPDKIQVTVGEVNYIVPTMGGVPLDIDPAPELTITAETYIWIKCVGTFGSPDSYVVTIETSSTSSPPTSPEITPTTFTSYHRIGSVILNDDSAVVIMSNRGGGDLNVESFGNANIWWTI